LKRTKIFSPFNKSGTKQIDIFSKEKRIIVEYDGEFHFSDHRVNDLEKIQKVDAILNSLQNEFCIIRVSYDQFSYRKSDYGFKKECLEKIKEILDNPQVGLHCLGDSYGESNIL
jgi:very-short-patch-repair endonuclease